MKQQMKKKGYHHLGSSSGSFSPPGKGEEKTGGPPDDSGRNPGHSRRNQMAKIRGHYWGEETKHTINTLNTGKKRPSKGQKGGLGKPQARFHWETLMALKLGLVSLNKDRDDTPTI